MGRYIHLETFVDRKKLFNIIANDGRKTKQWLQIDICALWESYAPGELMKLGWIPGGIKPEGAITKQLVSKSLSSWKLMNEGTVKLSRVGWVSVGAVAQN